MVEAALAMVTRESIAPGVQAGSGRPPWLTQPVVLARGDGVQAAVRIVGSGTAAVSTGAVVGTRAGAPMDARGGAAVGARVGAAVGARVGAARGARVGAAVGASAGAA